MEFKKYSNGGLSDDPSKINNGCHESVPTNGSCVTSFRTEPLQANGVYGEGVTNDEDECEGDDCIYTYKGDSRGVADLPSSFFKFDQGDSLSSVDENCPSPSSLSLNIRLNHNGIDTFSSSNANTSRHHQANGGGVVTVSGSLVNPHGRPPNDLFSPDMDFLEMDFDPGGLGDDEDDDDTPTPGPALQDRIFNGDDTLLRETQTDNTIISLPGPSKSPNDPRGVPRSSLQEMDVTDGKNETHLKLVSSHSNSSKVLHSDSHHPNTQIAECTISLASSSLSPSLPSPSKNSSPQPHCSTSQLHPNLSLDAPKLLNPQICLGQERNSNNTTTRQILMRLVKSNTLPEMRSQQQENTQPDIAGSNCLSGRGENSPPKINKQSCLSSSAPVIKNEPYYRAIINTSTKSSTNGEDTVELEVGSIMIWTVDLAFQKSLLQLGTSACGATAVCNVLKALGYDHIDPAYVNSCVQTRLRDNEADIPDYLFSRSIAGASHEDLIRGIIKASNGLVNGRFFQPKPEIEPRTFNKWLLHWICKGAVPVVTLNMQIQKQNEIPPHEIPDSWHHQMIFGISPDGIYMTNPIECVSPTVILPQLTSPSILLIRRSDVINRRTPTTDLRKLMRHPDLRWNELNVLGQVANLLLEEVPVFSSTSIAKRVRTSHIEIPAAYKGGITLFLPTNSPFYSILQAAPEEL